MDLILWRHADAQDTDDDIDDMTRVLTPRGIKQAARVANWLDRQLPGGTRILCSPAVRCEQTVQALARTYRIRPELGPEATSAQLLEVAQWPSSNSAVLVVGHQPTLGATIAQLLQLKYDICPVRKAAVWWLRTRERDGHRRTVIAAVQSPNTL